jgi:hypothetical protein
VVTAGESIYSIALGLAGRDSSRVLEIADVIIDANLGTVMPGGQRFTNPAYIEVGWTLQLPAGVAPPERDDVVATTYVVEPGDTLWDIADEQLGDPASWTEIWERNAGDDMGDGRTFDDPNLILPGWELDLTEIEPVAADVDVALDLHVDVPTELPEPAPQPSFPDQQPDATIPAPSLDEPVANGPLPLAPTPTPAPGPMTSVDSTSTSTTVVAPTDPSGAGDHRPSADTPAPEAPSPIRLEHAALLAAGILALVGVRRRQRLRAAMPRHRVPEPRPEVTRTERKLRTVDAGERVLRADVACRAAARSLIGTGSQIGWVEVSPDGGLELRLTGPATLPSPWSGGDQSWILRADVPVEMLGEDARQVGQPCVALVQLGLTSAGNELLVDLEACGVLAVTARADQADEVVTALAAALASSLFAEVAHLVVVSLPEAALMDHRNAHVAGSADAAMELACSLAGTTAVNDRTSFELRSLRTGGEMWEPAVVLLGSADDDVETWSHDRLPAAGHGVAIVVADEHRRREEAPTRLAARPDGWHLDAFGMSIDVIPIGVSAYELAEISELLVDADRELEPADPVETAVPNAEDAGADGTSAFMSRPHEIVVGLIGGVEVRARSGETGTFERSKTVELIAWLTTHRDRTTRSGARTALWDPRRARCDLRERRVGGPAGARPAGAAARR